MTVSGTISTTVFDVNRVIDAAYRRCKIPAQRITSEMQNIALDTLNFMFSAAPGKGLMLWATDTAELGLAQGVPSAPAPVGTIDIISANLKTGGSEIPLARIAQDTYDATPNKLSQGRPVQFWLDRQRDVPVLRLWPSPDAAAAANSTIVIRRTRHLMDVSALTQTLDIPQRWHDAIIWDLAWRLADETPGVEPGVGEKAKARSLEAWKAIHTVEEDNSPIVIIPRIRGYTQ